jgi:bacterioferritin-associated ferredoxin
MHEDDDICLCFHVSLRKIRTFLQRENPQVASLISECLSAGTGCGWCVPFLKHLHAQHQASKPIDLRISPEQYMKDRASYRESGERPRTRSASEGETP